MPWWNRKSIGLLLLGLIVPPWLLTSGPPGDATPARRIPGVGDIAILAFAFAPDGRTIATIQTDGRVALYDAADGAGAPSFLDHRGCALALAFSPDGRSLAVGGDQADILVYDAGAEGAGRPLEMPIRMTSLLAFAPDGRTLAASSYDDRAIVLCDLAAGRERSRLRGHDDPRHHPGVRPRRPVPGLGEPQRWGDRPLGPRHGPTAPAAGRPAGARDRPGLLAGRPLPGLDGRSRPSRRLWDLEGRHGDRPLVILSRARDPLAFSPDGWLLATAGDDGAVRLWDLATGAEVRRVGGSDDRLRGVAFAPDGRILAATGDDADIRLWDLAELVGDKIPP